MHIVCNWKAHGSVESIENFQRELDTIQGIERIIFCPPFPYIPLITGMIRGAQDVSCHECGPYTGDVTASMLQDIGVTHVLIGHSERRRFYYETDDMIVQKAQQLLTHHVTPIICIGEENQHDTLDIDTLIKPYLSLGRIWIAYEPTWAIGTQHTPSPSRIDKVVHAIKSAIDMIVLYGGSVGENNIDMLMKTQNIDGFLIGNASLSPLNLKTIVEKIFT
jgi:triosephosphate isomerase